MESGIEVWKRSVCGWGVGPGWGGGGITVRGKTRTAAPFSLHNSSLSTSLLTSSSSFGVGSSACRTGPSQTKGVFGMH